MSAKRVVRRSLIFLAIAVPPSLGAFVYVQINWGIDDAYAKWGAADLVIEHMRAHAGQWPPDWEALRPLYEKSGGRVGGWTFEHYKSRVAIDFKADPAELRRQSREADYPTFNVIWARWTCVDWGGGPNGILYNYFRQEGAKEAKSEHDPPRE